MATSNHEQSSTSQHNNVNAKPPPAPPLPPTTFAITLPTEIRFRPHHPNHQQPPPHSSVHHNENQNHTNSERKDSLLGLTKDAADILKIREGLETFVPSSSFSPSVHINKKEPEEFMDLEDSNNSDGMKSKPSSIPSPLMNGDSAVIDELLSQALEFPMDTDYSDWIESFSPDTNSCNPHPFSHTQSQIHHDTRDPLLSSKSSGTGPRNRLSIDNFMDHSGNSIALMDVDSSNNPGPGSSNPHTTNANPTSTETDNNFKLMKKEDNVNNVNDLWDFSF